LIEKTIFIVWTFERH